MNAVHQSDVRRIRDHDLVADVDRRQQDVDYSGQTASRDNAVALTAVRHARSSGHMTRRHITKMPLPDER
jgi:hypothetical protein